MQGPWNRVGLTHFSLNVRNTHKWHDYLKRKGVTIVSEPAKSPNGGQWFFFVKDCDGNLIEMMDLGKLHYLLALVRPARRFPVPPRHVQAVLRTEMRARLIPDPRSPDP